MDEDYRKALKILGKYAWKYLAHPDVLGVSVGLKEIRGEVTSIISIRFFVARKKKKPAKPLPKEIKGVLTDVVETRGIYALNLLSLDSSKDCTDYRCQIFNPCPAGVSIGHEDVTAGTLGAWTILEDTVTRKHHFLAMSNAHVLANTNKGVVGDDIYQPGLYDVKRLHLDEDEAYFGRLFYYLPVQTIGLTECPFTRLETWMHNLVAGILDRRTKVMATVENKVDVAWAKPTTREDLAEIIDVGKIAGRWREEEKSKLIGTVVQKSGRTTCLTWGKITDYPLTLQVNYGEHGIAYFIDQIGFRPKDKPPVIKGGDSGSLLLDEEKKVVGLCFAGSYNGDFGVANTVWNIINEIEKPWRFVGFYNRM